MDWQDKFQALESVARRLEPGPEDRRVLDKAAWQYAQDFLSRLEGGQTYVADLGHSAQLDGTIRESGTGMDELLAQLKTAVDQPGINPASGGHLGYIPGGGVYPAAIGDYLADISNRYSGVSFASPGAVRMEQQLIRWMCDLIGFPETAGGDLTSGGSLANLSCIVAAREARPIRSNDITQSCIYATRQVHHCVDKALRVAGLEECPLRFVPMDDRFRMDETMLEEMLQADLKNGLNPWLVIASAGTTDTGAVDPLLKISALARNYGLWMHVDAAYGGFFMLCAEGREALQGLDLADSVVMDPHKGLFLPYGSGAALVRDVQHLARANRYSASYMQDASGSGQGYSPADLSVELSRPFRGPRLWFPLKLFGLAAFRAALTEKIWLARYFHEQVSGIPGFEAGRYPDLSVVTFRYFPASGEPDAINAQLLRAVHADGRVFISSTRLHGNFTLRVAILHFRTHKAEVDYLLEFLRQQSLALANGPQSPSSPSQ